MHPELSAVQPVPESQLLTHGIYRLPVLGPHGETMLIAVDDHHHLTPSSPYRIHANEDPAEAVAWLNVELVALSKRPAHPGLKLIP
jgi:hypothetical protein